MYEELLDRWAIPRPRSIVPTPWGWNNDTFFVSSAAGEHVLRVSSNAGLADVGFEHDLLARLARASLPFAVPRPVPSVAGGTIELYDGDRGPRPASVFARIDGRHADDDDIDHVARGAEAYALLDRALATASIQTRSRPMSTDLTTISPAVGTLDGIEAEVGERAAGLIRAAGLDADRLTALPRQLIHGDFALGNILLTGPRVVGILDFEFSGHDLRAMELANALGLVLTKGTAERLWRPVLTAYLRTLPLTAAEIGALPTLVPLGRAAGLLWWVGRARSGLSSKTDTAERVSRLLEVHGWIAQRGDELVNAGLRVIEAAR